MTSDRKVARGRAVYLLRSPNRIAANIYRVTLNVENVPFGHEGYMQMPWHAGGMTGLVPVRSTDTISDISSM